MSKDTNMDLVSTFTASLEERNVEYSRVSSDGFETALEEIVERPAIGTHLSGLPVALPDWVTIGSSAKELSDAQTGITPVEFGIAEYGSIVLNSSSDGNEQVSLFPEKHVAVLAVTEIVPDMGAAFSRLGSAIRTDRGSAVIATGPSATADMGSLVYGVHGPESVHVVLVTTDTDENSQSNE